MSDSEDDLIGPEAFGPSDAEEEGANEYEVSDGDEAPPAEDEAESVAPKWKPREKPKEASKPKETAEAKADGKTWYVYSKGAVHAVPVVGDESSTPGVVRDRGGAHEVESLEELHEITSTVKTWPKPQDVHPLSIYVLKGRFSEGDDMDAESGESLYAWYMRFKIRGKPDSHENLMLRHMPRAVVLATLTYFAKNQNLKQSSLITDFQPHLENSKPLPMQLNGFKKAPEIRVETKPKRSTKKVEAEAAPPPAFEDYDAAESPTPAQKSKAKKPPEESPASKPEPPAKPAPSKKTGTMHQFAKPVKPKEPPAAAPDAQPPAAAPAPAQISTPAKAGKEAAGPSSPKRAGNFEEGQVLKAKKVCTATFGDKANVHLLWHGNTLHAIEL